VLLWDQVGIELVAGRKGLMVVRLAEAKRVVVEPVRSRLEAAMIPLSSFTTPSACATDGADDNQQDND
jgi:hypothetical protein